ncbi:hypothetical protein MKX01_022288 [Papaver californicum]|nr:hypothetical protein MKX01_022288 [Papaver californicum]
MKKQKTDEKTIISKPVEETANGGAVEANNGKVIMGSGATFKCDVKIASTSHDVIMECSPGYCYKRQGDDIVQYIYGEKSATVLSSTGFRNLTFRTYNGLGHYTVPQEMDEVCNWLTLWLNLEGSR